MVDESTLFITLIGDEEFLKEYKTRLYLIFIVYFNYIIF